MSLSDCEKCWETPCTCGHEWDQRSLDYLISMRKLISASIEKKLSPGTETDVILHNPKIVKIDLGQLPSSITRKTARISWRRGDGKFVGVLFNQCTENSKLSDEANDTYEEFYLSADQLDTIMSEVIKNSPK